jgi:hypothetical protein
MNKPTFLEMVDYALEQASSVMVYQWFKLLCFYYAIAAYGEFRYVAYS